MIVNGLEIFGFDAIPCDGFVAVAARGNVAHKVFDKNGIVVGFFGHVFFIRTLEQAVEFTASGAFDESNEVLDPDRLGGADGVGDKPALVVRTAIADRFGARAQCGDRNKSREDEIGAAIAIIFDLETDLKVDKAFSTADRCRFFQEKRKLEGNVRALSIEAFEQFFGNGIDGVDIKASAVRIEHFHEATHVRAFVVLGKIDGERNGGDGFLRAARFFADFYGKAEIFHADAIDRDVAVVFFVLSVGEFLHEGVRPEKKGGNESGKTEKGLSGMIRTSPGKRSMRCLRSEVQSAGALDLTSDLAMHFGGHSGNAARKNLAGGGGEFGQKIGVGVIDFVNRDVLTTAGHATVRFTESNATLDSFRFGFLHIR